MTEGINYDEHRITNVGPIFFLFKSLPIAHDK